MLKLYLKIWSGFTKFIRSQTAQGKTIDSLHFGNFRMKQKPGAEKVDPELAAEFGTFFYQPSIKFLDEAQISLHENEVNLNPYSEELTNTVKINIVSLANSCKCKVETVTHVLCEFAKRFYLLAKRAKETNQLVVLNFRIGFLKIRGQKVRFLNLSEIRKRGGSKPPDEKEIELKTNTDAVS